MSTKLRPFARIIALVSLILLSQTGMAQELAEIRIPFETFTLDNGLKVIVHTDLDSKSVKVATNYFVGSRDEPEGRSGFAHLYEHLMLQGSVHSDEPTLVTVKRLGGGANGLTSYDHTGYFEIVPYTALEYAIWLEADRMGHFLDSLTQEKFDNQRGVVQNEKRQRSQSTLSQLAVLMNNAMFGPDHPYGHPTIGSMEDLDAASLDDVKDWFKTYYGPNNAQLILSGRVTIEEARILVEKYFAGIAATKSVDRATSLMPVRTHNTAETIYADDIRTPVILRNWILPGNSHPESLHVTLATDILAAKSGDWLRHELIDKRKLVTNLFFMVSMYDLASYASLRVTLAKDKNIDDVRAAIDEVLARFRDSGPSMDDVVRRREQQASTYLVSMDSSGARATWLAYASRALGGPERIHDYFRELDTAGPEKIRAAARKWLSNGYHEILLLPDQREAATETDTDYSVPPAIAAMSPALVPDFKMATLENGIRVFVSPIHNSPLTTILFSSNGGILMDEGVTPGSADALVSMMERATNKLDAAKLSEQQQRLGAQIRMNIAGDSTNISVRAMTSRLDRAVAHIAGMLMSPRLDEENLNFVREKKLTREERAEIAGMNIRKRVSAELYGADHPLGGLFETSMETINALNIEELRQVHSGWFRPENLTVYVSGDTDIETVSRLLNRNFGKWQPSGPKATAMAIAAIQERQASLILLADEPNAKQTSITFNIALTKLEDKELAAFDILKLRLSGAFDSRLNMILREDKGWTYGVKGGVMSHPEYDTWLTSMSIQTDKTAEGLAVMVDEIERLRGTEPVTLDELNTARLAVIERLNSRFSSSGSRVGYLHDLDTNQRDPKEAEQQPAIYEGLVPEDVLTAAKAWLDPTQMVWTIEGDLAVIEEDIRALGLGEVVVVD